MDTSNLQAINDSIRPIATANMAAVVGMTILYGTYLLVFPICIYVLVVRRNPGNQSTGEVLVLAVSIQFISTTACFISEQTVMFKSFVGLADQPNALIEIVAYWSSGTIPALRVSNVASLINVAVGDAIMITTLIGSTSCGIVMVHGLWQGNRSSVFVRNWAVSAWTLGIGTQAYSTSLIAWEVWRRGVVTINSSRSRSSYYKAIIAMIVESGALYTALVLPLAISFGVGAMSASLVIAGLLTPMSALIPASMVIRVCLNRTREFRTTILSQVAMGHEQSSGGIDSSGTPDPGIGLTFVRKEAVI
ncbi:hypothetical protein NP233_g7070 [Leucocoprinus birnbaumii]|uniref:Uncharacterized protein n=1 Tax=Leucocoprinus birnbaumii TaxID=56174 RepID=A0AAD5VPX1_9AGAR|nr:hypothetical protein NP233_g7070 [Leucocoprinus birnbaumii]